MKGMVDDRRLIVHFCLVLDDVVAVVVPPTHKLGTVVIGTL